MTKSMDHSHSLKVVRSSARQEITRILWPPKISWSFSPNYATWPFSRTTAMNPVCSSSLPLACYVLCAHCLLRYQHPNNIRWSVKISTKLPVVQFSVLHSPPPRAQLSSSGTLFSNTLSLCSFFDMKDQVSHSYHTRRRITILRDLILISLHYKN